MPGSSRQHTHLQHGGLVGEADALEVSVGVEAARHRAGVEGAEELLPVPTVHQVVAHIPAGRPLMLTQMLTQMRSVSYMSTFEAAAIPRNSIQGAGQELSLSIDYSGQRHIHSGQRERAGA